MKGLHIFDTESDGLAGKSIAKEDHMTKFHVLLFKEYGIDNWNIFLDKNHPEFKDAEEFILKKGVNLHIHDLNEFNQWIVEEPIAIGCQNLEGFDMLAFEYALGTKYERFPEEKINGKKMKVYDTLSMSRNLFPDRPLPNGCPSKIKNPNGGKAKTVGSHSLEAWGYKVANKKVEIEDWKGLPLWKYCSRVWEDVIINELQWKYLIQEMKDGVDKGVEWRLPLQRGAKQDYLMVVQEQQGVVFDSEKAWELIEKIDNHMKNIEEDVEPHLPLRDVPKSEQPNFPAKPFNEKGEITHHGWNYAKNVLGYGLNQEYFDYKAPPKTAFKKDGTLSVAGHKYCLAHGHEDESTMKWFINTQREKGNTLEPLPKDQEVKLRSQLENKYIPEDRLKEPMKLSNQDDIKKWLVTVEGWRPTIFNTKDVTKGSDKKKLLDSEIEEKVWQYVVDNRDSIYVEFLQIELDGIDIRQVKGRTCKVFNKLLRKARNLPTTPKFKDERGKLCPMLDQLHGDMAKQIVTWLSCRNRRSVVKSKDEKKTTGWLNHPRLKLDGKLPARYSGLTPTYRRKHSIVANVPGADALYGHEMRDLFTVPAGWWQIGIDGSNLEGMVAAQAAYPFDNGAYYKSLSGDPHTTNSIAYSKASNREVSRSMGKGITYG
ncbi:MAG: hypothetical protein GY861_11590 [bacterium]|nr:hypothetical protein [bacterium]